MEITITKHNIKSYELGKHPDVVKIIWKAGLLSEVLENFSNIRKLNLENNEITSLIGISTLHNLRELYCNSNQLTSLRELHYLTNLQILNCYANQITSLEGISNLANLLDLCCGRNQITSLVEISNLANLQELYCHNNCITSLNGISKLNNLHTLSCGYNEITSLNGISYLTNLLALCCSSNRITCLSSIANLSKLHTFYCISNEITSLREISNLVNLQELCCNSNKITMLDGISNLTNLQKLLCNSNKLVSLHEISTLNNLQLLSCIGNEITSLDGISTLTNLQKLYCADNHITSLEPLFYLRQLVYVDYQNNLLELPTIRTQRMLDRINTNAKSSVYHDKQNVHDIHIQHSVCESITNLLRDPKPTFTIDFIINSSLSNDTIEALIEYCNAESVHSVHLITYMELLSYVWQRINKSEHSAELLKILGQQVADSECKCFTGRFNRTLGVLVGFYDDIKIEISDKSRISAIILASKDRINPYSVEAHQELAKRELLAAGYTESEIDQWIGAIE